MTNAHLRRHLPNRLFPAAVAAITIAASAPFGASAHAQPRTPPKAAIVQAAGKIPTLPRANTTRGDQVEGASAV